MDDENYGFSGLTRVTPQQRAIDRSNALSEIAISIEAMERAAHLLARHSGQLERGELEQLSSSLSGVSVVLQRIAEDI